MSLNPQLLRDSFALVVERQPQITVRFYEIFFSRYPQVRPMFGRHSGSAQERMLQEALVAVIEHIEDSTWLVDTLGSLGRRHVDYGVTKEMYDWVGECLIAALREAAGEFWTSELQMAWSEAYVAIVGLMLDGAEENAA